MNKQLEKDFHSKKLKMNLSTNGIKIKFSNLKAQKILIPFA